MLHLSITPSDHNYIFISDEESPRGITLFLLSIVEEEIGDLTSKEAQDFLVILRDLVCSKLGVKSLSEIGK